MCKDRKPYGLELRKVVLEKYFSSETVRKLSNSFGITENTIYNLVDLFKETGDAQNAPRRKELLIKYLMMNLKHLLQLQIMILV